MRTNPLIFLDELVIEILGKSVGGASRRGGDVVMTICVVAWRQKERQLRSRMHGDKWPQRQKQQQREGVEEMGRHGCCAE
jgi:hypothetical protein